MSLEPRLGQGPCASLPQEQQELGGGGKRERKRNGGRHQGRSKGIEWREKGVEGRGRGMEWKSPRKEEENEGKRERRWKNDIHCIPIITSYSGTIYWSWFHLLMASYTTHYTSSTCGISSDVHFFTVFPSPHTVAGMNKHCVSRQPVEIRYQVVSLGIGPMKRVWISSTISAVGNHPGHLQIMVTPINAPHGIFIRLCNNTCSSKLLISDIILDHVRVIALFQDWKWNENSGYLLH